MIKGSLLTEGNSDQVLLPILRWLLGSLTLTPIELVWADLRGLIRRPRGLAARVKRAVDLYPCDILFVHRDRDKATVEDRDNEIRSACASALPHVAVIPVQMQEAWLLIDEAALRRAAGKPTGRAALGLPKLKEIEGIADPKARLYQALRDASEARGRRAKRFSPGAAAHRMATLIDDWSPLMQLTAFQKLERDTCSTLEELGVHTIRKPLQ